MCALIDRGLLHDQLCCEFRRTFPIISIVASSRIFKMKSNQNVPLRFRFDGDWHDWLTHWMCWNVSVGWLFATEYVQYICLVSRKCRDRRCCPKRLLFLSETNGWLVPLHRSVQNRRVFSEVHRLPGTYQLSRNRHLFSNRNYACDSRDGVFSVCVISRKCRNRRWCPKRHFVCRKRTVRWFPPVPCLRMQKWFRIEEFLVKYIAYIPAVTQ